MTHSFFSSLEPAPSDPILGLNEAFRNDNAPNKVNLGVGIFQDDSGRIPILGVVKEAAARWLQTEDTKTYLPIDGVAAFNTETRKLLFGADSTLLRDRRVATVQSIGGSGALKLGVELLRKLLPSSTIFISDPSWENHRVLFEAAGARVETYPYYDPKTNGLRSSDMLAGLRALAPRSIVLLHTSCHNPTGVDLTPADWKEVIAVCKERELMPFLDFAYQGFAEGVWEDALPIRLFADAGLNFLVANSYSKSFSLYRERVGALSVVTGSEKETSSVTSNLKRIVRSIYSSPPSYGAQIVSLVLSDAALRKQWEEELAAMRTRILEMRGLFTQGLAARIKDRDFSFITKQRGMFSYSGLQLDVIKALRERYHIYALDSGRICLAAMNRSNIDYICDAIAAELKN